MLYTLGAKRWRVRLEKRNESILIISKSSFVKNLLKYLILLIATLTIKLGVAYEFNQNDKISVSNINKKNLISLEAPAFSKNAGIYRNEFNLELTHPSNNVKIIYTLDGSEPDIKNLNGSYYIQEDHDPVKKSKIKYSTFEYITPIKINDVSPQLDKFPSIKTSVDRLEIHNKTNNTNWLEAVLSKLVRSTNYIIGLYNNFIYKISLLFDGQNYLKNFLKKIKIDFIFEEKNAPISLPQGIVVRARAVDELGNQSKIVTNNYMISQSNFCYLPII